MQYRYNKLKSKPLDWEGKAVAWILAIEGGESHCSAAVSLPISSWQEVSCKERASRNLRKRNDTFSFDAEE